MFFKKKKKLLGNMSEGVDMIKMGTFRRLVNTHQEQYGDKSKSLAATIVNELFSCENQKTMKFRELHPQEIKAVFSKLKDDDEICYAVTQAVRVMATIEHANGNTDKGIAAINRLINLEILVSGGDAPNPHDFLELAGDYLVQTEHYDI